MKNKLIVDRNQAKEIRNKDICQIVVNMRIRDGANNQNRATKNSSIKFLGS